MKNKVGTACSCGGEVSRLRTASCKNICVTRRLRRAGYSSKEIASMQKDYNKYLNGLGASS
jgi:hypothetical protein